MITDFERIKKDVDGLTPDERVALFGQYCKECGGDDPNCQCWNDE